MKLTDKQRKRIIAEYVAGDGKVSQQQLAKKYGVSPQVISKLKLPSKRISLSGVMLISN